jgi:putative membrane protein
MLPPERLRATDTLANERTYLAYVRTALAFIGFGFVIARFSVIMREAAPPVHSHVPPPVLSTSVGIALMLAGVLCAGYGAYRYIANARALRAAKVAPLDDRAAIAGAFIIAVFGIVVVFVLPVYQ